MRNRSAVSGDRLHKASVLDDKPDSALLVYDDAALLADEIIRLAKV
ncbi:MAG: hypothetical protein R3F53_27650 [Gammaproteobacteria bacterium]